MTYDVALSRTAERRLRALAPAMQDRFERAFRALEDSAMLRARPGLDVRPIVGAEGTWRLRVGPFRAIFAVRGRTVLVTMIIRRSQAYR